MTRLRLEHAGHVYVADASAGHDISIAMDFHGAQPSHFGAGPATAQPMRSTGFVGDTRAGGSCNAEVLSLNPHCNGTHTECLGHVTRVRHDIVTAAPPALLPAALVSVRPVPAEHSDESTRPHAMRGDRLITAALLGEAWAGLPDGPYPALVVRTLPNHVGKRSRHYTREDDHPYFSLDAIHMLVDRGVQHLLVDTPSIDRFDDQGELAGHRLFWGLAPGAVETGPDSRSGATVTEMIYVEDSLADGVYLLNLQIAPFMSDAAPSRPLLFSVQPA